MLLTKEWLRFGAAKNDDGSRSFELWHYNGNRTIEHVYV